MVHRTSGVPSGPPAPAALPDVAELCADVLRLTLSLRLDALVPSRIAPLPATPDACQDCGHRPDECADLCCWE